MPSPYWMDHNPAPAPAPDPAPAPERAPDRAPERARPMPETCPDHVPKEALDLIELLIHFRSDMCSSFVYKWMELPRRVRKEYSYNGAIKCRDFSDPKHDFCQIERQHYFDPTNWVYALTMRLMMPKMMKEVNWNNETKGDIFESILGCHYLVAHGLVKEPVGAFEQHIGTVSAIFEAFVWCTWRLCDAIGNHNPDSILRWVTWIIDMVADRQRKDEAIGTIVLHETLDEFEFEPRCKSKGYLIHVLVA